MTLEPLKNPAHLRKQPLGQLCLLTNDVGGWCLLLRAGCLEPFVSSFRERRLASLYCFCECPACGGLLLSGISPPFCLFFSSRASCVAGHETSEGPDGGGDRAKHSGDQLTRLPGVPEYNNRHDESNYD